MSKKASYPPAYITDPPGGRTRSVIEGPLRRNAWSSDGTYGPFRSAFEIRRALFLMGADIELTPDHRRAPRAYDWQKIPLKDVIK